MKESGTTFAASHRSGGRNKLEKPTIQEEKVSSSLSEIRLPLNKRSMQEVGIRRKAAQSATLVKGAGKPGLGRHNYPRKIG